MRTGTPATSLMRSAAAAPFVARRSAAVAAATTLRAPRPRARRRNSPTSTPARSTSSSSTRPVSWSRRPSRHGSPARASVSSPKPHGSPSRISATSRRTELEPISIAPTRIGSKGGKRALLRARRSEEEVFDLGALPGRCGLGLRGSTRFPGPLLTRLARPCTAVFDHYRLQLRRRFDVHHGAEDVGWELFGCARGTSATPRPGARGGGPPLRDASLRGCDPPTGDRREHHARGGVTRSDPEHHALAVANALHQSGAGERLQVPGGARL